MAQHRSYPIEDRNVSGYSSLINPFILKRDIPLTETARETVVNGRRAIEDCLRGKDSRTILVVGPCSIHDPDAYKDYANRLNELSKSVEDTFIIVQRSYFEKPRTTIGWPGLIKEPYLDGKVNMNDGLIIARQLLAYSAEIGLPTGTEFVYTRTPQWIDDLVSWAVIGARGVTSPELRHMASSLSMATGFKNTTDGNVQLAVDAVHTARYPNSFDGMDKYGMLATVHSKGNKFTHVVLRGSDNGPNYDAESVKDAQSRLKKLRPRIRPNVMIDASHGNSSKDHNKQPSVFENVIGQIAKGNKFIIGIMLESNINPGRQNVKDGSEGLEYGVSITDACIGWDTTKDLILDGYKALARS